MPQPTTKKVKTQTFIKRKHLLSSQMYQVEQTKAESFCKLRLEKGLFFV